MGRSKMIFLIVLQVFLNFYSNIVGNNAFGIDDWNEWIYGSIIPENHFWQSQLYTFEETLLLPVDVHPIISGNFPVLTVKMKNEILSVFTRCELAHLPASYIDPLNYIMTEMIVEWKYLHDKSRMKTSLEKLKSELSKLPSRPRTYENEQLFDYTYSFQKVMEDDLDAGNQNIPRLYRVALHILKIAIAKFSLEEQVIINERVNADTEEYLYNRTEIEKLNDPNEVTKLNEANGLRFALNITIVLNRLTRILEGKLLIVQNNSDVYSLIPKYREKPLVLEAFTYPDVLGLARSLYEVIQNLIEDVYSLLRRHKRNDPAYLKTTQYDIQATLVNYYGGYITTNDVIDNMYKIKRKIGDGQDNDDEETDAEDEDIGCESTNPLEFEKPKKGIVLPSDIRQLESKINVISV